MRTAHSVLGSRRSFPRAPAAADRQQPIARLCLVLGPCSQACPGSNSAPVPVARPQTCRSCSIEEKHRAHRVTDSGTTFRSWPSPIALSDPVWRNTRHSSHPQLFVSYRMLSQAWHGHFCSEAGRLTNLNHTKTVRFWATAVPSTSSDPLLKTFRLSGFEEASMQPHMTSERGEKFHTRTEPPRYCSVLSARRFKSEWSLAGTSRNIRRVGNDTYDVGTLQ